ncbi:MAG: ATP-binding cassette domain-containing protein, partial [Clostridiaceae bacterium]|nr:ATP-binding cassette domain-containing protein [Clostridiaceae bacterium]
MKVLTVENIKKVYGGRQGGSVSNALNGISFDIEKRDFVGIMGPSGAGKSTLLNVIATIDTPTSGSIKIGNKNIV